MNNLSVLSESSNQQVLQRRLRTIDLLVRFGHRLGMPHSKKVDRRLFELRVRGRQEVRIFYAFHNDTAINDTAILLHGFIKKSQKIPERELATAKRKLAALDRV